MDFSSYLTEGLNGNIVSLVADVEFSAESTALRYIEATTKHLKCSRPYGKRQPLVSVVRVEICHRAGTPSRVELFKCPHSVRGQLILVSLITHQAL